MFMGIAKKQTKIIRNKVQEWCQKRNMNWDDFLQTCMAARLTINGKRLSYGVVAKVWSGEITVTLTTAMLVSRSIGASVEDLFDTE